MISNKTISPRGYRLFIRGVNNFYRTQIPNLASDNVSTDTFLDQLDKVQRETKDLACICTPNFSDYSMLVKKIYPYSKIPAHERLHAEVSERYGLKVEYGLIVVVNYRKSLFNTTELQVGFVVNSMPLDGRRWTKDKILSYYIEMSKNIRNPRGTDKIIAKSTKRALKSFSA